MLARKMWDYVIDMKKEFVQKREIHIDEQLRKGNIRLLKPPQIVLVFL